MGRRSGAGSQLTPGSVHSGDHRAATLIGFRASVSEFPWCLSRPVIESAWVGALIGKIEKQRTFGQRHGPAGDQIADLFPAHLIDDLRELLIVILYHF